jgi:hypothetical protein
MTRQEAIEILRELAQDEDTEEAHAKADGVLCSLLRDLGCDDVVEEWHKVRKWYA